MTSTLLVHCPRLHSQDSWAILHLLEFCSHCFPSLSVVLRLCSSGLGPNLFPPPPHQVLPLWSSAMPHALQPIYLLFCSQTPQQYQRGEGEGKKEYMVAIETPVTRLPHALVFSRPFSLGTIWFCFFSPFVLHYLHFSSSSASILELHPQT